MKRSRLNPSPEILLISGDVGGTGGISVLMLELAARVTARGLHTKIVVPAWDATLGYANHCRERGIPVERTEWLNDRSPRLRGFLDLLRLVHKHRAPVVHYHVNNNTPHHLFLRAAELLRVRPMFITYQSTYDQPAADHPAARRWAAAAPRYFKKVICASERGRRRQISYGLPPELVQVIYNGVDIERFGSGDSSKARHLLKLAGDVPLIVFSSRIEPQKRPFDVVSAFRLIATEFPTVNLVFVGQGALEPQVRAEAEREGLSSRIHFVGYQFNIPDWLAAATVWFLPTETEGFSLAVIEAMAAGCPIVSTVCPGNDEVLVDGDNALLTAVGDVTAQAAALRRLLSDEALRRRLSFNARRTAGRYSLDRMVEEHLECYGLNQ